MKVLRPIMILFSVSAYCQDRIPMTQFTQQLEYHTVDRQGNLEKRTADFAADSGSIRVPENRRTAGSRSISVPVVRFRALHKTSDLPVFWLSGGPGQSNLHSFSYDYFLQTRDHVMVGYRGVDGEVSLDCPEVTSVLKDADDILDPAVLDKVSKAFKSCAARFSAAGIDRNGYTPMDVAEDIEQARRQLGYDKIDLVAESYGTRIAYIYALQHPDRIERMILIGPNPPGGMVWDPVLNDSLLVRYGELWKNDPDARRRTPDLVEAIRKVRKNFPRRWLFFPIHEGTVRASANAFLFHCETAAQVFDTYCAAADGDASGLWLFSFIGSRIFPTIVNWGDNASKAVSIDFEPGRDYLRELDPPEAIVGAPLGAFLWAPAQAGAWPMNLIPERLRRPQPCDVQTLFVSGSLDFSTPADHVASGFVPMFRNGHHIILSEAGHVLDLWQSQPAATRLLVTSFLERGIPDTSLVRYTPVSFKVRWGFPLLAKLLLAGVFTVLLVILWGSWTIGKRIMKKRLAP